ncbi:hypothetical protein [Thalassotalea sp. PLHSN55]|uniref:hypothetical protein n=1 Tax=Thalassotalea sp. PLHSN55 TaxID=3435888 RepID=UPI003F8690E6
MGPHGHIDYTWQGNVLVVKTSGPFNLEGVEISAAQIVTTVQDKAFSSWYRVDFLDADTLGSPAVMNVIGKSYLWSGSHPNCKQIAVCCHNSLQFDMMKRFVAKSQLPLLVFSDPEETDQFIKQCSEENFAG